MLKLFSLLAGLFVSSVLFGQKLKSIEISLIGRTDIHGNYASNFGGRAYNDTNKISGVSFGVSGLFRHQIARSWSIAIGIGYYRLKVDKVRGNMPFNGPGVRTARSINYDDGVSNLAYGTSKYYYNDLAFTISIDKSFKISDNLSFDCSPEWVGYYSLSQNYTLSNDKHWKTTNNKPLEYGVNVNLGIVREYKHFYLRPSIIIPVYQNLKGDVVFYEDTKMNISKWFSGVGLSLKIGKYI
jgi:hypothetical protein